MDTTLFEGLIVLDCASFIAEVGVTVGAAAQSQHHLTCPQVAANGLIRLVADGGGLQTIDSPIRIQGETKRTPRRAPDIGLHSREVLAQFSSAAAQINALVESGAVSALCG